MNAKEPGRRRFLKGGAALAGLSVGALRSAGAQTPGSDYFNAAYGTRSPLERSARNNRGGALKNPLQDQMGIITPASLHHYNAHGYFPPDIDPREHRLLIHGLVDHPLILTLEELKRLPSVSRIHFVECNSNTVAGGPYAKTAQETHGSMGCSLWIGVLLSLLLQEAGLQKRASWIVAEGEGGDKHTKSIPLEKALDDCLVAYGQNGEAVRPEQGYPLRLVVPGWEGLNNVKWLRRIKVVDQPYMGMRESTKYPSLRPDGKARWFQFEMGPKSVITRPSGGQQLSSRGFYEISGLAWSGGGAVRRVEVSTDGGQSWKDAELQEPVLRKAHTRFVFPWIWDGEETVLQSRCTDERGDVQPTLAALAKFWGATPYYFKSTSPTLETPNRSAGHINAIQPWRVTREGSVHNAMYT